MDCRDGSRLKRLRQYFVYCEVAEGALPAAQGMARTHEGVLKVPLKREMSWDNTKTTIRKAFLLPVRAYQKLISPMLGANCIYSPTCSEYFKQAVMKHGIIKGSILGTSRILRCNRFYMGGPDPVPKEFSFRHIKDRRTIFRRRRH